MIETLDTLDKQLLVYLNNAHSSFLDLIMVAFTGKLFWLPLYALIIAFLVWKFRYGTILILVSIGLLITLCDRFSSGIVKPATERLRPCNNTEIASQLVLIDGCGGKYGFFSSHAANTFGLSMFLWLLLRKRYRWIAILFLWAFLVSYSRVYLGKHYPGDIICGALSGVLFAWLVYFLYIKAENYFFSKELQRSTEV